MFIISHDEPVILWVILGALEMYYNLIYHTHSLSIHSD